MNNEEMLFIVNGNGDILQEVGTNYDRLADNSIVIRPKSLYRDVTKINFNYAKTNIEISANAYKEYPQIIYFIPYLEYKTNFLMYSNGRYINQTGFAKEFGLSRETISNLFSKFKKADIIKPVKLERKTVYMLNPYIAIRGSYIYSDLMEHFKDTKWANYKKRRLSNSDIQRKVADRE